MKTLEEAFDYFITKVPHPKDAETPYAKGFHASGICEAECPYPEGTLEHDAWWDGFSDATDGYLGNF
jgi:hypothetical protein